MSRTRIGILVLAAALLAPGFSRAQSLYGAEGLGLWDDGYDVRARGAGSTAVADTSGFASSSTNPALAGFASEPQFHVGFLGQMVSLSKDGESDRLSGSRISGLRVTIPLGDRLRIGAGYRDLTDGVYRTAITRNEGRGDQYTRHREGTGGIGFLSGHLAVRSRWGAAGLELGSASGTLREMVEDDFRSGSYVDTRNLLRTRIGRAHPITIGGVVSAIPRLELGAAYTAKSSARLTSLSRSTSGVESEARAEFDLPAAVSVGLQARVSPRLKLGVDFLQRDWGGTDFEPEGGEASPFEALEATQRLGLGVTWLPASAIPKDPLFRRSEYRLGFTRGEVLAPGTDAAVHEWAISAGVGLPAQVDRGMIDVSLEFGRRGDGESDGLRETFLRLGLSATYRRLARVF